jgi:transposase
MPELKSGDIVIMDDPPAHKVAGVRDAKEAAGASRLYLPPYCPDFNPIERALSKPWSAKPSPTPPKPSHQWNAPTIFNPAAMTAIRTKTP